MALIFETDKFIVESHEKPFVSRDEGGHIRIIVKDPNIVDRTKASPKVAIEYMRLSCVVGQALETVMNRRGVPVIKVNYQDMGNWSYKEGKKPQLHYHIMGRVLNAPKQPFPESVYLPDRSSGFYVGFKPLNSGDVEALHNEIITLFTLDKFSNKEWGLI